MLSAALLMMLLNKPACTKKNHGEMWPTAANNDKTALMTLARAGTLEMCMSATWGYKWQRLSVRAPKK